MALAKMESRYGIVEDLPKGQLPSIQEECRRNAYHLNEAHITPDSVKQSALGAREDAGGQEEQRR